MEIVTSTGHFLLPEPCVRIPYVLCWISSN